MDFEMKPYIVYIKTVDQNRIIAVNSSAFLDEADGWVEIDSGFGVRFRHAQGNYFDKPLYDERGIMRYMITLLTADPDRKALHIYEYEDEQWGIYERTQEEMDADYIPPVPVPDPKDIEIAELKEQVAALSAAFLKL